MKRYRRHQTCYPRITWKRFVKASSPRMPLAETQAASSSIPPRALRLLEDDRSLPRHHLSFVSQTLCSMRYQPQCPHPKMLTPTLRRLRDFLAGMKRRMGRAANGVRVEEFLMVLRNDMLRMVSGCVWTIQPWSVLSSSVVGKRVRYIDLIPT